MADDQYFETWDDEFLEKAIELTEAAVCSAVSNPTQQPPWLFPPPSKTSVCSSVSNPTHPPPQLFPPPLPPDYAPHISYSPPRELSQRVKEDNPRNFPDKGFDCPASLNGINRDLNSAPLFHHSSRLPDKEICSKQQKINRGLNSFHHSSRLPGEEKCSKQQKVSGGLNSAPPFHHSSRLHDEEKCSKQQEIDRLKEELGRVSKVLTNLEQECLELRKDREKNEKHLKSALPVNESKDAESFCTKKPNLKNKDLSEDSSIIHSRHIGTHIISEDSSIIHPGHIGVWVQTDEVAISTELTIKKNPSKKLTGIWEAGSDQTNLVSKLFMACEEDLQVLFGCLGLNIPSKKTTTKADDFLYMAQSHCIQSVESAKVSHLYSTLTKVSYDIGRLDDLLEALMDLCCVENMSSCVSRGFETHFDYRKQKLQQCTVLRDNVIINDPSTVLTRLISAKKKGSSKWLSYFQLMHQIITKHSEEIIRVEAVSIMNILLLRTDAYSERETYGEVAVFQSISKLLRKEAGVVVQKQTVHLLYLLLNCPNLMSMFCTSCKEVSKTAPAILDALADCLACGGNDAPTTLVLKLQRNAIILVAFLASSGRGGYEILLGRRTNFLFLILEILASEMDVETSQCIQPSDDFRERTLVIREALILLNRLASSSQYSTPVLRGLTNRREMACLTVDIATRLSRKPKWLCHQSDTMTVRMREYEILDLARIFKKRVFNFLGDTP